MENENTIEKLLSSVEKYSMTTLELAKLNAASKMACILAILGAQAVTWITLFLSTLILSFGLAMWLGELMGKTYYGFSTVGAFYLLVYILVSRLGEGWIKNSITNSIVNQLIKDKQK